MGTENCLITAENRMRLSNKIGDNEQTLRILEQVKPSNDKINFYYLDYLYAMSKLYKLNFAEAESRRNI